MNIMIKGNESDNTDHYSGSDPLPFKSHPRPVFCPHTLAGAQHETESQIPPRLTLKSSNGEWDGHTN